MPHLGILVSGVWVSQPHRWDLGELALQLGCCAEAQMREKNASYHYQTRPAPIPTASMAKVMRVEELVLSIIGCDT